MRKFFKGLVGCLCLSLTVVGLAGCGSDSKDSSSASSVSASESSSSSSAAELTNEARIKAAANAGKLGNWGGGNEYEIYALLAKYGLEQKFVTQAFDMDGFDEDQVTLASAMTYNELGLVQNSYTGGYGYGDTVGTIDMNDEGVAMLEDNLFTTKEFATANPNTVKAFIYASMRGWAYACENLEEAAEIVYSYGSSVSSDHQVYMASEVKKLVTVDTEGNTVTNIGALDTEALQQTLDLAKQYISLTDSTSAAALSSMVLSDFVDSSYFEAGSDFGALEKTSVKIQLKWLPQAQFMGYYVALSKGYYEEAGFEKVEIVSGGGEVSETNAVTAGTVDFGVTWVSNLITANAGGMSLLEIAQVYQKSGLVLVYKK